MVRPSRREAKAEMRRRREQVIPIEEWERMENTRQQKEFADEKERERVRQENFRHVSSNVNQVRHSGDKTSVFGMLGEGLGIESVGTVSPNSGESLGEVGGARKRRKKQDTGGGLGIG